MDVAADDIHLQHSAIGVRTQPSEKDRLQAVVCTLQLDWPPLFWYLPAAQTPQPLWPAGEARPAAQLLQLVAPTPLFWYCPLEQAIQFLAHRGRLLPEPLPL